MVKNNLEFLQWNFKSQYKWATGYAISLFFGELKNSGKLIGVKCQKCRKVLFPPQDYCEFCSSAIKDFVEVSPYGVISAVAKVYDIDPKISFPTPYAYILVQLKGADTSFLHIVRGEDVEIAEIGSPVRAVIKEKREGNILDIERFVVVKEITSYEEYPKPYKPSPALERVVEIKGELNIPFNYSYGRHMLEFYNGLRDKKILATRCPQCNGVFLPPRPFCPVCFVDVDDDMVKISDKGVIKSWTKVYMPFVGQPTHPPYIYALITLDGCDTEIHHIIGEEGEKQIYIGMRVNAVWSEERVGTIHDIKYFKPV